MFIGMHQRAMAPETAILPLATTGDAARVLLGAVERMQLATCGSAEFDALIDAGLAAAASFLQTHWVAAGLFRQGAHWSRDLSDAISLLPEGYNFSLGHRDGICWAWIQPNDAWEPGEFEQRHDHPEGSGLVVGYTAALALTCAAMTLYIRGIERMA